MYTHTQTGRIMILSAIGMLAAGVAAGLISHDHVVFYLLLAMSLLMYFGFKDLTVEVDHEAVRLRFGVGIFKKEFKLRDIVSVRAVRNPWWCGWGIRMLSKGWLYNVAGLDAVELVFKNGRLARIGTDEPQVLEAEIKSRSRNG